MSRVSFAEFKEKALQDAEFKNAYEALTPEYELRKQLILMRKKAGLTQEELAKKLNTKKSNISRLENFMSKSSPKLSTIQAYAKATGHEMKIEFV